MSRSGSTGNPIDRALRGGRVKGFIRLHNYEAGYPVVNAADGAILVLNSSLYGASSATESI
jgi:lipoprotein signal peptidase